MSHHTLPVVAILISLYAMFGQADDRLSPAISNSTPWQIDLKTPGDAIRIHLDGKPVGGLRVDSAGRLGLFGPNLTSTAITIDALDCVQIDPEPVEKPVVRLSVANDVWLTGVLRVGRADAFGQAAFDPNGAIQLGRNLPVAQPFSLLRAFGQGEERFRLGLTQEGYGFWSNGPHDTPLVMFRPLSEDKTEPAEIRLHAPLVADDGKNPE